MCIVEQETKDLPLHFATIIGVIEMQLPVRLENRVQPLWLSQLRGVVSSRKCVVLSTRGASPANELVSVRSITKSQLEDAQE